MRRRSRTICGCQRFIVSRRSGLGFHDRFGCKGIRFLFIIGVGFFTRQLSFRFFAGRCFVAGWGILAGRCFVFRRCFEPLVHRKIKQEKTAEKKDDCHREKNEEPPLLFLFHSTYYNTRKKVDKYLPFFVFYLETPFIQTRNVASRPCATIDNMAQTSY